MTEYNCLLDSFLLLQLYRTFLFNRTMEPQLDSENTLTWIYLYIMYIFYCNCIFFPSVFIYLDFSFFVYFVYCQCYCFILSPYFIYASVYRAWVFERFNAPNGLFFFSRKIIMLMCFIFKCFIWLYSANDTLVNKINLDSDS